MGARQCAGKQAQHPFEKAVSRTMSSQHDLEPCLTPSAAQNPRRCPPTVVATRRRSGGSAALATYRDLGARGLAPVEAGNLAAYLSGLRPVDQGWTVAEINRLLFLRFLFDRDRLDSLNANRAIDDARTNSIA